MDNQSHDTTNESTGTDAGTTSTQTVSTTRAKLVARQAFQTTDGQNFFDAEEAAAHQSHLDNTNTIEAYLVKANIGAAQAGMLRNTLPAFLAFKAEVDAGKDISDLIAIVAKNEAEAKAAAKAKAEAKKAEEEAKKKAEAPAGAAA